MTDPAGHAPASRDWETTTFEARHRRVLAALAEALFDDGTGRDIGDRIEWMIPEFDRFVSMSSRRIRAVFRTTLLGIELSPMLVSGRPVRFSSCSLEERVAILDRLDHRPPLTMLLVPWKTAMAVVYYEHPESLWETGYDDTCLTEDGDRRGILGVVPVRPK